MVVIGSKALHFHIDDIVIGNDIDLIMTYDEFKTFIKITPDVVTYYPISNGDKMFVKTSDNQIYEIEIAWPNSSAEEFMNLVLSDDETYTCDEYSYPSLNALYAMKMSHRYLRNSPHFMKTMNHILRMRASGALTSEYYNKWLNSRMKKTYDYGHPSLDAKKYDFFKNESFYIYDHDDIHVAVSIGIKPAYTYIKANEAEVNCDKNKFDALPFEMKLNCALEESYVLALERSLIPNDFSPDPKKAFIMALTKVCTSITSGWFREWCWENYFAIKDNYNSNYVGKFHSAYLAGKIGKFNKASM